MVTTDREKRTRRVIWSAREERKKGNDTPQENNSGEIGQELSTLRDMERVYFGENSHDQGKETNRDEFARWRHRKRTRKRHNFRRKTPTGYTG